MTYKSGIVVTMTLPRSPVVQDNHQDFNFGTHSPVYIENCSPPHEIIPSHSLSTSSIILPHTPLTFTASPAQSDDEELTAEELETLAKLYPNSPSPFMVSNLEKHGPVSVRPFTTEISQNDMRRTIAPLSNLPTPPAEMPELDSPMSASCFPGISLADMQDPDLVGQSRYLADYIPVNASNELPRSTIILGVLVRAEHYVSMEVLALAGCVLDSLSSNFPSRWRQTFYQSFGHHGRSELLAITALIIAVKFLNDRAPANSYWSDYILDRNFSIWMLNTTERMMLQDNDYCINYLASPKMIATAVRRIRIVIDTHRPKSSPQFSLLHQKPVRHVKSSSTSTSASITSDLVSIFSSSDIDSDADMISDTDYYSDSDYSMDDTDGTEALLLKPVPSYNNFRMLVTKGMKQRTPEFEVVPQHLQNPIYPVSAGMHAMRSLNALPVNGK